jgi:hypothetical protein
MKICCFLWLMVSGLALAAADSKPIYENNFTSTALDKVPEEMLILDGGFAVKEEGGNKFLELPGAPLETYGAIFGPTEPAGLAVSARIQSTAKGRRFPTFGIGLNGVAGYKLQVAPAKKMVELYRGEELLTNAPYTWEPGSWVMLRLQSRPADAGVKVEAKVWKQGDPEPKTWQISFPDKGAPPGRPSLWGMPFAGTAVRFDDLAVSKVEN